VIAVAQVRLAAPPALRQGGRVQGGGLCACAKLRGGESVSDVAPAYSCVDCIIDLGRSGLWCACHGLHRRRIARKVFHECGVAAGGDDICVRRVDPLYPGVAWRGADGVKYAAL
jgi:hypothetical protein